MVGGDTYRPDSEYASYAGFCREVVIVMSPSRHGLVSDYCASLLVYGQTSKSLNTCIYQPAVSCYRNSIGFPLAVGRGGSAAFSRKPCCAPRLQAANKR